MQAYPCVRYHKELAPEGRLVRTADGEPTGEGWVDTPAAFDPNYVPPPPLDPNVVTSDAVRPGYVPQRFPACRYDGNGNIQLVKTQEEADTLDPRQWKDSPAAFGPDYVAPSDAPRPAPPAAEPPTNAEIERQKAELFAATVPVIVERIEAISDVSTLATIRAYEEVNPKGARTGVLKAVDARFEELAHA